MSSAVARRVAPGHHQVVEIPRRQRAVWNTRHASGGVELVVQRRFRVAAVTTWIIWELWDGTGLEGKRWEKADGRRVFGGFEVV